MVLLIKEEFHRSNVQLLQEKRKQNCHYARFIYWRDDLYETDRVGTSLHMPQKHDVKSVGIFSHFCKSFEKIFYRE